MERAEDPERGYVGKPRRTVGQALGSILLDWATPAEAAACDAFGAILSSLAYRKLSTKGFYDALIKSLEISVLIMLLIAASNFFGAVFSRLVTPTMLTEMLPAWDMSATMVLIIIMAWSFCSAGRLKDIYFGMMQFMVIQLIGLILVFSFPQIALWLPAYMYGN